jgi:voltage-gated potassium channel
LVHDGRVLEQRLAEHGVGLGAIRRAARGCGVGGLEQIAAVVLEADGSLSVIGRSALGSADALVDVGAPPGDPGAGGDPAVSPGEQRAEDLARVLDIPFTAAGLLFVVVVVADTATEPGTPLSLFWSRTTWVLWSLFVVEFVLRLVLARSTARFLRRNWWQIVFLAVPFLRFLRAFTRTARLARVGSSSVRSTRTAAGKLGSRLAWLVALTLSVVLIGTNLLYDLGQTTTLADALHLAALAAVAGEGIPGAEGWGRLVEITLVAWSSIGFAALAGSAGAFLVERHEEGEA